jgi:hypothetical protein
MDNSNMSNLENINTGNMGAMINSPLYGEPVQDIQRQTPPDVHMLRDKQITTALNHALSVYQEELSNKDYTPLTINSYSSAVNRFIDFLELGYVAPDYDNKPQHQSRAR